MEFIKKDIKELELSPAKAIGDNWGILTGCDEDGFNSMTVSWGALGVMWSRPCVFAFVRPQRYTKEFMDKGEYFSLSLMPEGSHEKMKVFGSTSGRDTDKYAASGFTPMTENGVTFCGEAETVFICRKLSAGKIGPECFTDPDIDKKNYQNGDYHTMYIGEITEVLVKK